MLVMPGTEAMFVLVFHATWLIYERVNAKFVCNMFFSVKEHKVCEPLSISNNKINILFCTRHCIGHNT